jgi:hypothetical protein
MTQDNTTLRSLKSKDREGQLLTEQEASELLRIALPTLRNWRCQQRNLPFVRFGRVAEWQTLGI